MKKFMIPFLIIWLLTVNAFANVDIVTVDDIPFVSWCTDRAYIAACSLGIPSVPVPLGNDDYTQFVYASICLTSPAQGNRLLIACSPHWMHMLVDTVYILEPENLNILNQRPLNAMEFGLHEYNFIEELHLPRYWDGSDTMPVVANIGDCTTDAGVFLSSASLRYPDVGPMLLSDTLKVNIGYGWGPPDLLGPVVLPDIEPLSLSCHGTYNPVYYEGHIRSHLHQEDPGPMDIIGDMYTHCIWSTNCEGSHDFLISALGSSSSEAVALWTDSSGAQFSSIFIDSIVPSYTLEFPFPHPTPSEPAAMSRNPLDNGLLLAWYHDGEIRARHWLNEWNSFDHIVASGQPSVSAGNIAVCSVDDGYWVACLPEGADLPVLAYVNRGTVTGIVSSDEYVRIPVVLYPSHNPFRESVNLTVVGDPLPERLDVFDITGRLIRVLDNDSTSNTFLWDGKNASGQEMPPGTYFVQASSADGLSTVPLVKL
jgi:hypothetical protein